MTENSEIENNATASSRQERHPLPGEYEPQPGYVPPDEQEQRYREYVARRRECLAAQVTPEVLDYLDEEFRTDLPCFQTRDPLTGQTLKPDPICAALRDGQREVILWLRHEIAMHRKQKNASPL